MNLSDNKGCFITSRADNVCMTLFKSTVLYSFEKEKPLWWMWRLWKECDWSLNLSPRGKKSELLMCRLTPCVPSPCEVFTEQLSLWPAPLTPSNITWLSSGRLTGGTLCLSTPHTPPLTTHILLFLRFQPLLAHRTSPYLLVSKRRSPEQDSFTRSSVLLRGQPESNAEGQRRASITRPETPTTSYRTEKTDMK